MQYTETYQDEAAALAWHLFQEQGLSLRDADALAAELAGDLLVWAAAWDAEARPARSFVVERSAQLLRLTIRDGRGSTSATYIGAGRPAGERRIEALRLAGYVELSPDGGDDDSGEPAPHDPHEDAQPVELDAAARKAAWFAAQGVAPVATIGGHLVPSGTRAALVHLVNTAGACSCEAGRAGRRCWHRALVEMSGAALVAA